jgi:hypothetical protein
MYIIVVDISALLLLLNILCNIQYITVSLFQISSPSTSQYSEARLGYAHQYPPPFWLEGYRK